MDAGAVGADMDPFVTGMPPIEPLRPGAAEMLLAYTSDVVVWYAEDGVVRWASPALERVFGWRPAEVIGTVFRLAPPGDQERSRSEVVAAVARGDAGVTVRARAQCADGSLRWADTAAHFVRDEEGHLVGSVAVIRDVTAEVESEERYRLLAQNATDMVYLRDVDGTITWASPSAREVLGVDADELVGTNTLAYLHPDDRPLALAVRAQVGAGESARGVVARLRCADGQYRYMSLVSRPVTDESGAVIGAVGGIKDVDDLVRARMVAERERALLLASSESMLEPQVLLEAVRDSSGTVIDFTYLDVNRAVCYYLHVRKTELLGTRLLATLPGLSESGLFSRYVEVVESGRPYSRSGFRYSNELLGEERYYDIRAVRAGPDLFSLTWSDVTERLLAERRIEASEERYRLLAENVSDVVVHVRDGCVVWVSPSVEAVFGAPPEEWVGRSMEELVHPDDLPRVVQDIADLVPGVTVMSRQRIRGADAVYHWVESNSRVYVGAAGVEDGFLTSLRVVDALVVSELELDRRARTDDVTGLMNRAEVLAQLGRLVDRGRRRGDNLAVLFCDVDWFKDVNDKHGHAAGDEVLRVLAERISATIRKDDVAARFGGDELLVVLVGVHGIEEARHVAEKVRLTCRDAIDLASGEVVQATVSIGVVLARAGEDIDALIADADRAMYRAKQSGRDRVVAI
jgi:diguanylate cyclase (GGDEF)-like protein/PAS domain S-box-containing protein